MKKNNVNKDIVLPSALWELLTDIFSNSIENRKVIPIQHCITQGWVAREDEDLKLCENPDCVACTTFKGYMDEVENSFKTHE